MKAVEKILVVTDFSLCAGAAADAAAQLASQLRARVDVVTVVDTSPLLEAYGDVEFRTQRITAIRSEAQDKAVQFVKRHFGDREGVNVHVRDGNTFLEILQAAQDLGSDGEIPVRVEQVAGAGVALLVVAEVDLAQARVDARVRRGAHRLLQTRAGIGAGRIAA